MNSWCRNLELLIKSRTSLIWIRTKEEERLEKLVNFSCERLNIKRFILMDSSVPNLVPLGMVAITGKCDFSVMNIECLGDL